MHLFHKARGKDQIDTFVMEFIYHFTNGLGCIGPAMTDDDGTAVRLGNVGCLAQAALNRFYAGIVIDKEIVAAPLERAVCSPTDELIVRLSR